MQRRIVKLLLATLATASAVQIGHAKLKDAGDTDVQFFATGTGGMKINGKARELKASEKDGKISVTVPVAKLDTGMRLRDKHLRGYLNAEKCPQASLSIERSKLKFPNDNQEISAEALGELTLHCVTKPMKFKYRARRTGSDYHVEATPEKDLDIRDHEVKVPSYLGVTVRPHVKLQVRFKIRDE